MQHVGHYMQGSTFRYKVPFVDHEFTVNLTTVQRESLAGKKFGELIDQPKGY